MVQPINQLLLSWFITFLTSLNYKNNKMQNDTHIILLVWGLIPCTPTHKTSASQTSLAGHPAFHGGDELMEQVTFLCGKGAILSICGATFSFCTSVSGCLHRQKPVRLQ